MPPIAAVRSRPALFGKHPRSAVALRADKKHQEDLFRETARAHKLSIVVLRYFNVYGAANPEQPVHPASPRCSSTGCGTASPGPLRAASPPGTSSTLRTSRGPTSRRCRSAPRHRPDQRRQRPRRDRPGVRHETWLGRWIARRGSTTRAFTGPGTSSLASDLRRARRVLGYQPRVSR